MDSGPKPRSWIKRVVFGVCAVLLAVAVLLVQVRAGNRDDPYWSGPERDGLHALVESELTQATRQQQNCVADYVIGHFSPLDWLVRVKQLADLRPFSGDAIHQAANASRCASK